MLTLGHFPFRTLVLVKGETRDGRELTISANCRAGVRSLASGGGRRGAGVGSGREQEGV